MISAVHCPRPLPDKQSLQFRIIITALNSPLQAPRFLMESHMQHTFFATCSKGLEALLEQELRSYGADELRQTVAGVYFSGELRTAYRAIVFSRLANRVILSLQQTAVVDAEQLYRAAAAVDWTRHLNPQMSFAISAVGSTEKLKHTQFVAQKIKDAVVDQFRSRELPRPNVSRSEPDLLIHAVLKQDKLTLGIDLAGKSLHRRNYRSEQGEAPLKETLAAALLMRAGWPQLARQPQALLYDPMCGSGTLLIEGLLMALDIAPGLLRGTQLSAWLQQDAAVMEEVVAEARQRQADAAQREVSAYGSDIDARSVAIAERNAQRAGVSAQVSFTTATLKESAPPRLPSLLICNPPYAERLGEEPQVELLYGELGTLMKEQAHGTQAAVFTAKPQWGRLLGIHSHKQYAFFNGALPARLLLFTINDDTVYQKARDSSGSVWKNREAPTGADGQREPAVPVVELDAGAQMFANRLRKNLKSIGRWARQQGHECYRLYDADMPEYAFAIDLYASQVHMQEYKAPASVSDEDAALRRRQAFQAVSQVLQVPAGQISLKVRERQRGTDQYRPGSSEGEDFVVHEGKARFWVNLQRYLDTGLFLDHRPMRRYVHEHARGSRFLNLFCYTGSVTVQAALGGAQRSISVDLSKSYLAWAARNLELNGLSTTQHELVQMDCLRFLKQCRDKFDLIFLDPPTFSNSKSTDHVLDIQRDHKELVQLCMQTLAPKGLLIFSTNHQRFRLDESLPEMYQVEDWSAESIDRDFARNPRIHKVWLLRHPARQQTDPWAKR